MRALLTLLLAAQAPAAAPPDSAHVVIVATTDVHGRALAWDYVRDRQTPGGLSRAASIIATLRAQYPGQVVLVDAGDLLQGNLFGAYFGRVEHRRPNPMVDALNALNYDAATPGNHDFDFGWDQLLEANTDATYRYVSGNIVRSPRDSLAFPSTLILTRGGVRIGITGFTTPGVMVWDRRQLAGSARVRPIATAAPAVLAALDRAGVDFKVVLVHSGLDSSSSYDTTGVGPENAAGVSYDEDESRPLWTSTTLRSTPARSSAARTAGAAVAMGRTRALPASWRRSQTMTPGVVNPVIPIRTPPRVRTTVDGNASESRGDRTMLPLT